MEITEIKKAIIPVSVATLVWLIGWVSGITMKYSNSIHSIDTRIIKIEQELNKWGRFTAKDGQLLEQKIQFYAQSLAEIKWDIREIKNDLKTMIK